MNRIKEFLILATIFHVCCALLASANDVCQVCQCDKTSYPALVDCRNKDLNSASMKSWTFNQLQLNYSTFDMDLDHNELVILDHIKELPIEKLSFKFNQVAKLNGQILAKLKYLSYLDLSYNVLTGEALTKDNFAGPIYGSKGTPSPLLGLNLAYNNIKSLNRAAFENLVHLQELILDGNPIQVMDHSTQTALTSLKSLTIMSLVNTQLESLPRGLLKGGLVNLTKLDLASNKLQTVPVELANAKNLEHLSVANNPIQDLTNNSFTYLTNLKVLNVSYMRVLSSIGPSTFGFQYNLTTLIAEHNPMLEYIHPDIFAPLDPEKIKLKILHLGHNALTYLSEDVLPEHDLWMQLSLLDLSGNSWTCDCHMEWILHQVVDHMNKTSPELLEGLACHSPPELEGYKLTEMTPEAFKCNPEDTFNPYHRHFGRAIRNKMSPSDSQRTPALGIAIICVMTICASMTVVAILYFQREKTTFYRTLQNVRFRNDSASSLHIDNNIYRDNPTTIRLPVEP